MNIRSFDIARSTEWPKWVKLLNFNFTAMHVKDNEMKRAHFFSVWGEGLYNLTCNIVHSQKMDTVEYSKIIQALTDDFKPQINEVASYYRFDTCT